jgi:hypothetical protein
VRQGQFLCRAASRKRDEKKNAKTKKGFHRSSVHGLLRSLFHVNACAASHHTI